MPEHTQRKKVKQRRLKKAIDNLRGKGGRISDRHHEALSAIIASSWRLSSDLVEAVGRHHNPETVAESARPLAYCLAVGDQLTWRMTGEPAPAEVLAGGGIGAYLEALGIDTDAESELREEAGEAFAAVAKSL